MENRDLTPDSMHELQQPEEPIAPPAEPAPIAAARRPRWRRVALALLALVVVVIAGASSPCSRSISVRRCAPAPSARARNSFSGRCTSAGLSAKITPGVFVVENLVIEGLQPADRPFLTAKKIEVVVPWWTIFSRKLIVESVEMTDWDMVVETWPSSPGFRAGATTFPKFTRESKSNGPKRFTTTLQKRAGVARAASPTRITGRRGAPATRGLRVSVTRGIADRVYRGARVVHRLGTITHSEVRAVPRRHAVAVHDRRIAAAFQRD